MNTHAQGPLFIFHGNGSFWNRGCEAILRTTVKILQKEFGDCRFMNFSPCYLDLGPEPSIDATIEYHIPSPQNRRTPVGIVRRVTRRMFGRGHEIFTPYLDASTAVLALGGDNYSLDYGLPYTYFQANNTVVHNKKPMVIWGASVGPFSNNAKFEKYAARELKKVSLICARESETVAYLKSIGVEDNVRQVADPAFLLDVEPIKHKQLDIIEKTPCIGLNLHNLLGQYRKSNTSWIDCAAQCTKSLLASTDMPVILIQHVFTPSINKPSFTHELYQRLGSAAEKVVFVDNRYNSGQLKYIISKLKLFIGGRTHATIASLSSCVPTISIGYSMKARGINKDIFGHTDWVVPVQELDGKRISEVTRQLLDNHASVKSHLVSMMPEYKKLSWSAGKFLRKAIEAR